MITKPSSSSSISSEVPDRIPSTSTNISNGYSSSPKQQKLPKPFLSLIYSPKLSLYLLATCVSLFILFQIQSLHSPPPPPPPTSSPYPWSLIHQFQNSVTPISTTSTNSSSSSSSLTNCTEDLIIIKSMAAKLIQSVTFLPLKDLRYSQTPLQGHTWFMSSLYDTHQEGEVQFQQFPSPSSQGRLLCIRGRDTHDGSWNSYALAWPDSLPNNATLLNGITFVSYNHYNYDNIWHGLSAVVPFVAWHLRNGGCQGPDRWVLYHWGELRTRMGPWLSTLMEATFGLPPYLESFDNGNDDDVPVNCFEEAVVMRHNEGGMSRDRRMEVYDLMRCKARAYCNVSREVEGSAGATKIGLTMFMRTGARSFKNETAVIRIFERECRKTEGCKLMVAYSNNLTFCQQVKLMSLTDVLVSPHGAQLTNMFLMDRNSSVMEFFPKGWLKLAGVGQFVYQWIASWSGMRHQGAWRDPDGDHCPYPDEDRRCMSIYKSGRIGYNETHFAQWARNVLNEVRMRKLEEASTNSSTTFNGCACN